MKSKANEELMSAEERYLLRLKSFYDYYLLLVIFAAAAVGVGIFICVVSNLFAGIALVILAACIYIYFSTDEAYKQLGVRYKNTDGHIVLTRVRAIYGEAIYVPSRLIFADVRVIGDKAFNLKKNAELTAVYLPASIERIGKDIFGERRDITVLFQGSREQWGKIDSATDFSDIEVLFDCTLPSLPKKEKQKRRSRAKKTEDEL